MAQIQRAQSDQTEDLKTTNEAQTPGQPDTEKPSLLHRHPLWAAVILLALIGLGIGAYFIWLVFFHPYETTDDAFVDARSFSIAAKVSGYLADVSVTDNQHLEEGAVIARIEPRDYQIALDQADAQVASAQAAITNAQAQIEVANAAVEEARAQQSSAEAALQYARDEAARQKELVSGGAGSLQTSQQADSTLRQAQASYTQSGASITSAMKNENAAEAQKASARAQLKEAQAQRETAVQNLNYTTITAAQPGRIVQLSGAKGQFIQPGQAIAIFVPDDIWVTANFKETQLADMRPGQPADLVIDAYPDHKLHGKVLSVQPGSGTAFSLLPAENATGNYVKVTQRVPVKIAVDEWPKDVAIGPGMSVVPTVTVRPGN